MLELVKVCVLREDVLRGRIHLKRFVAEGILRGCVERENESPPVAIASVVAAVATVVSFAFLPTVTILRGLKGVLNKAKGCGTTV